jgi:hypothetical protein
MLRKKRKTGENGDGKYQASDDVYPGNDCRRLPIGNLNSKIKSSRSRV